jgi:prepilin signal peptidase PulO-like enzyme (type II secretory pathway)
MTLPTLMVASVTGAVLGSAAGSALIRWPTGGSVLSPARSRCATCGRTVRAHDLIPVVSWLLLRGRCRSCGRAIDARLPLLEGASAAAAMGVVQVHGLDARSGLLVLGVVAVLLASLTDLEERIIPDRITLPLAVVAVPGMLILADGTDQRWIVIGSALGIPLILESVARASVALGARRAIGGGDVKLLIGLLALSVSSSWGPSRLITLALLYGGVHAAGGLLLGRLRLGDRVPFAPAISLAFLTVVLLPRAAFPLPGLVAIAR